jgi:hypothetical protein
MDIDLSELVDKEFVGVLRTRPTTVGSVPSSPTSTASTTTKGKDDETMIVQGWQGQERASRRSPKRPRRSAARTSRTWTRTNCRKLLEEHDLEDEVDLDKIQEAAEEGRGSDRGSRRSRPARGRRARRKAERQERQEVQGRRTRGEILEEVRQGQGQKEGQGAVDKSDVMEMDEDELQELLEEHDLEDDVDLDKIKKIGKKREAVCEALDDEDLLNDDD